VSVPLFRDHLEDLRGDLPVRFRDVPEGQVADLWLGWSLARHGHNAHFLQTTVGLSAAFAAELVSLAQSPVERSSAASRGATAPNELA